jgi:hypothetical protein
VVYHDVHSGTGPPTARAGGPGRGSDAAKYVGLLSGLGGGACSRRGHVTLAGSGTLTHCSSSKTGDYGSLSSTINIASATCSHWEGSTLTATNLTFTSTRPFVNS